MVKKLLISAIQLYRAAIAPTLIRCCRFSPTCSEYCKQAVERYGVFKGLAKGIWRMIRCQPLSRGGWDPA